MRYLLCISVTEMNLLTYNLNCILVRDEFQYIIFEFSGDESPYMIFEYMEHGDLTEVLRRNDPCLGSKNHIRLRQVCVCRHRAKPGNNYLL